MRTTLNFVKSRVLWEEQHMKMRVEETNVKTEASALVSSHPDSQSSHQKCKYCGRKNHRSDQCWKESPHLAAARFQRRRNVADKASAFVADKDDAHIVMNNDDFSVMMAKARQPDAAHNAYPWVIDSGCTSHMTFDALHS